ncbi:hypothetical protein [uncultured Dysosmobacter sp.]|uniref:hypothetical protein n=1 Tax=uncultured Dysosmobacter sp. TaxID=2591384 RepID=UPI00260328A4|nr:hypothetical protein [uncultured Dysosmobacter sp.]
MRRKKLLAMALASVLLAGLLAGCAGTERSRESTAAFQSKAESLRAAALSDQVREQLEENPAGEAGYAVFFSVCDGENRASVYSGTGETLDAAWAAGEQAAEKALKKGGPFPLWLKADLVYVSAALSADALKGIGEVFGAGCFRYGLAFDPAYETALLEAELNTAGIYDYENGGVDLERLNAYLEETGRAPLASLPESYTAFQCAGWLCGEEGGVSQLSLDELSYGRREFPAVDGNTAAALALDGAEYLAAQVQEDGSVLLPGGEPLSIPRHTEVLSAMIQGYRLHPSETLAKSIDRSADWLVSQIAYTEQDIGFLLDNGEITLEDSALSIIALADCAGASENMAYLPACQALGSGILSLLDSSTGTFTHVLDASDLSRKEQFRSAQWDGMGVTALCRLYGMTEDPLWLWAAQQVLDRMLTKEPAQYGDLWTACAVREITKYVQDRTDYFTFALKNLQGGLAAIYSAQGTEPAGLEMLMISYETYHKMLDAGYSIDGFAPELLLEVISTRVQRQLDGYLFPEFAMYFAQPQKVLGAFMTREDGLCISSDGICRNIASYYLYSANYDRLLADGLSGTTG